MSRARKWSLLQQRGWVAKEMLYPWRAWKIKKGGGWDVPAALQGPSVDSLSSPLSIALRLSPYHLVTKIPCHKDRTDATLIRGVSSWIAALVYSSLSSVQGPTPFLLPCLINDRAHRGAGTGEPGAAVPSSCPLGLSVHARSWLTSCCESSGMAEKDD